MYLPLIAAFIAISGGISVSYMADNSLPGDALYPVKVNVNEEVRHLTARSPAAEARVSESIIAERAQEARTLAREGRLDPETINSLSQNIKSELKDLYEATSSTSTFESQVKTNGDVFQLLGVTMNPPSQPKAEASYENNSSSTMLDANAVMNSNEGSTTDINSSTSLDAKMINVR